MPGVPWPTPTETSPPFCETEQFGPDVYAVPKVTVAIVPVVTAVDGTLTVPLKSVPPATIVGVDEIAPPAAAVGAVPLPAMWLPLNLAVTVSLASVSSPLLVRVAGYEHPAPLILNPNSHVAEIVAPLTGSKYSQVAAVCDAVAPVAHAVPDMDRDGEICTGTPEVAAVVFCSNR